MIDRAGESSMQQAFLKAIAWRLMPGADLKQSLLDYCIAQHIEAACIVSCVGSLRCVHIRFAGRTETTKIEGRMEIVSLVGTLSRHGCHLHIALADERGQLIGGHLADQSKVDTTAEIVLGIVPDLVFLREQDVATGYKELRIEGKP
jgi:predicted DNA-binding protein with PD1-like motif